MRATARAVENAPLGPASAGDQKKRATAASISGAIAAAINRLAATSAMAQIAECANRLGLQARVRLLQLSGREGS